MVEFGEQLRKAREEKGMTQQSLAEQLYVTRQSVSRWECGDRYPDLLTTKKISQILDVSLDDLLSGKEMTKMVERNPVIEKNSVKNIMIAFYSFVVISFFITIADIIIRFPLQSEVINHSDIQPIIVEVFGLLIQIAFFSYGLFQAIIGTLSPRKMGIVIVAFFVAMCITGTENLSRSATWQMVLIGAMFMIPSIIGAVASFLYFIRGNCNKACTCLIYLAAVLGMFRLLYSNYNLFVYASQYISMNHTMNLVLKIAIYVLIVYQTHALYIKRKTLNLETINSGL